MCVCQKEARGSGVSPGLFVVPVLVQQKPQERPDQPVESPDFYYVAGLCFSSNFLGFDPLLI